MNARLLNTFVFAAAVAAAVLPVSLPGQNPPEEVRPAEAAEAGTPVEVMPAEDEAGSGGRGPAGRRPVRRSEVVVFGRHVVIEAHEETGDVVVVFGSLTVNGTVRGDAVVVGGSAILNGTVRGGLVAVGGSAVIAPEGRLMGEAIVVGGSLVDRSAAGITGERVELAIFEHIPDEVADWFRRGLLLGRLVVPEQPWTILAAGIPVLFYFLLTLIFRGSVGACVETLETRPGASALAGVLLLPLVPVAVALLGISVVGVFLVPVLVGAMLVGLWFGKAAVLVCMGRRVLALFGARERPLAAAVVAGGLLLVAVYMVPVLGVAAWGATVLLGLGTVICALPLRVQKEAGAAAPAAPAVAAVSPAGGGAREAAPGTPPPSEIPPPAERAGFGPRVLASALDIVLVMVLVRAVGVERSFMAVLALYHAAMWVWRQTTVGGIILNLRLVRVDGRPVDFATALVRMLAAFLSAGAAFLGFLWVLWDGEKQSWHDKIAGTTLVKVPKGTSLV